MQEFQPLLDLLSGHFGFLPTLLAWVAAIKTAMTFFENQFAHWIADKLNQVAASSDQDDDEYLAEIFSAKSYRLVSFLLRFLGFRFPTLADLDRAIRLQREAAIDAGANLRSQRSEVRSQTSALRHLPSVFLTSALCLLASGCGTLDKSGVYQGDAVLYQSELAITTSYDVIHTYVTWEKENRAALAHLPQIRKSADLMRVNAPHWFRTAHALHDAYRAEPSDPNKTALADSLALLRTALVEAAGYMSTAAAAPLPP